MRRFWVIALLMGLGAGLGLAQQTAQSSDAPIPQDQWKEMGIKPPVQISSGPPEMPDKMNAKINGRCLFSLTIDVNGMIQNIKIIRCSDPLFAKIFLDRVMKDRFKPATTKDDKPVAVETTVSFSLKFTRGADPGSLFHYGFGTPPGTTSSGPDANGVYPLTKLATRPILTKFSDEGYDAAAFPFVGSSPCDIVITISAKGTVSDPQVIHCERPALEKPAIDSLLKSKYTPGSVDGKAVPIRALIHLEFGDVPAKP
ncbi:MAG: energy transducer TonB [Terracidiphilus sp.]